MKTIIGVSQFFHQNEPKLIALIGNISLLMATLAGLIASLPQIAASVGIVGFVMPALLATVAKYCLVGGVIAKTITKLFGTVDANGIPVTTTLPSTQEVVAKVS